ncbi:hypothetical protein H310_04381 [Aphanomyces invadans]|uniref:Uncharacterized protein n=1 Tax=Aphanomyces invadans TaxID=157072 RepID=A0A024UDM4_9STRA|nr:hypothetical protein H310_04381 [Aphanomyces invadans]ETW03972.1 hypothetical protein H310_04381 [Aphanomyces invadans]|eukprot:XP_008866928.1 hypothetical protein H310_04381 [Aphanomyces invadans]
MEVVGGFWAADTGSADDDDNVVVELRMTPRAWIMQSPTSTAPRRARRDPRCTWRPGRCSRSAKLACMWAVSPFLATWSQSCTSLERLRLAGLEHTIENDGGDDCAGGLDRALTDDIPLAKTSIMEGSLPRRQRASVG